MKLQENVLTTEEIISTVIRQDMRSAQTTYNGFSYRETDCAFIPAHPLSPQNGLIDFEILKGETVIYKSKCQSMPIIQKTTEGGYEILAHPRIYDFPKRGSDQKKFIYLNNNKLNSDCSVTLSEGITVKTSPVKSRCSVPNSEKELFIIRFAMRNNNIPRPDATFTLDETSGEFSLDSYLFNEKVSGKLTKEGGKIKFTCNHPGLNGKINSTTVSFEDNGKPYVRLLENCLFDQQSKPISLPTPTSTHDSKSDSPSESWGSRITAGRAERGGGKSNTKS